MKLIKCAIIFVFLSLLVFTVIPMALVCFPVVLMMSSFDKDSEILKDFCNMLLDMFEFPFKIVEDV